MNNKMNNCQYKTNNHHMTKIDMFIKSFVSCFFACSHLWNKVMNKCSLKSDVLS